MINSNGNLNIHYMNKELAGNRERRAAAAEMALHTKC
jgi:hypothetical protein